MAGGPHSAGIISASARETTRNAMFDRDALPRNERTETLGHSLPLELDFIAHHSDSRKRLLSALETAPRGVRPLDALLNEGVVHEEGYYQALARRLGCAYYDGQPSFARHFDPVKSLRSGVAPLEGRGKGPRAVIAPRGHLVRRLIEMTLSGRLHPGSFAVASPQRLASLVRTQKGGAILAQALGRLPRALTAREGLSAAQTAAAVLVAAAASALGAANSDALIASLFGGLWLLFLTTIVLRSLAAVADGSTVRPRMLSDDEVPIYTVIAAVYRESEVIHDLVRALDALDYSRSKLDIKIVVEQRDRETLSRILSLRLPARYEVIVAPPGEPLTKPRALNVALSEARGDLVVVYDAEDEPSPDQLRLAASRFAAENDLDCLQARLTIRNGDDSWLSKLFSVEYAVLFDLINPGLCALKLPIALGGTSNHFRLESLVAVGGWDEWNVAEDADLGIRIARFDYRVASLDSDTSEEAPHELANWFRQRVRWQKGWIQTCIVHSREPLRLIQDLGARRAAAATVLIFGSVISALFWPAFAFDTVRRAIGAGSGVASTWREAVDVFTYVLALAGVWAIVIPAMVAAKQRGFKLTAKALALLPAYYVLLSAAAWWAVFDAIVRPHYWAKTAHGRARRRPARSAFERDRALVSLPD
jgi:cellulose synthase/poly-beta-1,6-N-acetylglucosamine synthase-like glycosyltransferase